MVLVTGPGDELYRCEHTLGTEQLLSWEASKLNAHYICCQSHRTFVVLHFGRQPRCIDGLGRTHAHLCQHNTT